MQRFRVLASCAAAVAVFAGCDGLREAFSAHQDVVARAAGQELTVTRLAELLSKARIPVSKDFARELAGLWVDYQLLGVAAVRNDSLKDPKLIDDAMYTVLQSSKARRWYEQVSKTFDVPADTAFAAQRYAAGDVLSARHILFTVAQDATPAVRDSIRRRAEAIRAQATPANFAALAQQHSQDPGSASRGGLYPAFPKGMMVGEFEQALVATQPGQVAPLVQTQFGYHVIYRPAFREVAGEVLGASQQVARQHAESTYIARLEAGGRIQLRSGAARSVKTALADMDAARRNTTVLGTSKAGELTVGELVRYLVSFPPDQNIEQQLTQAPDTVVDRFVKRIMRDELVVWQADSAKITVDTAETNNMYRAFGGLVTSSWMGLRVDPRLLADSAKTPAERQALAARRIESYLDALVSNQAQFVDVPKPLESVLRDRFEYRVIPAGVDRAVEAATKLRAASDSAAAAAGGASAVPMPGARPAAPQGAPTGAPPAPPGTRPAAPRQP